MVKVQSIRGGKVHHSHDGVNSACAFMNLAGGRATIYRQVEGEVDCRKCVKHHSPVIPADAVDTTTARVYSSDIRENEQGGNKMQVTITAKGYEGIKGQVAELRENGAYVAIERDGIDLAPRNIFFVFEALEGITELMVTPEPEPTPEPAAKVEVTVIWSNARLQIHCPGCADIKKMKGRDRNAHVETYKVADLDELAAAEFADFIAEDPEYYSGSPAAQFATEYDIKPCAAKLF